MEMRANPFLILDSQEIPFFAPTFLLPKCSTTGLAYRNLPTKTGSSLVLEGGSCRYSRVKVDGTVTKYWFI